MFIELIDLLRCTRPHEDSWLVAAFHELRDRDVVEGVLSCPVCETRYPIREGAAWFDVAPGTVPDTTVARAEDGMRVAAYLNLVEPGIVMLGGAWGTAAESVALLGSTVLTLNAPDRSAADARVSRIHSDGMVPLARECLDGIALDSSEARLVESGARALKTGARIVAPAEAAVPADMREIARDEKWWVAGREGAAVSAPVQIARR